MAAIYDKEMLAKPIVERHTSTILNDLIDVVN